MNQEKTPDQSNHPFSEQEIYAKAHEIWKTRVCAHTPHDDRHEAIKMLIAEKAKRTLSNKSGAPARDPRSFTGSGDKTFWDFLQLLIVPGTLVILSFLLQYYAKKQDDFRADDKTRQETLVTYLNQMADSLGGSLLNAKSTDAKFLIAQVRTVTALQSLSPDRQHLIIQFLNAAKPDKNSTWKGLLEGARLYKADLRKSDFSGAPFSGIILNSATLIKANFRYATLSNADLAYANLSEADLSHSVLNSAKLHATILDNTDFTGADFTGANLTKSVKWSDDQLSKAILCKTQLPEGSRLQPDRDCK